MTQTVMVYQMLQRPLKDPTLQTLIRTVTASLTTLKVPMTRTQMHFPAFSILTVITTVYQTSSKTVE